jgi:hypothetical protein
VRFRARPGSEANLLALLPWAAGFREGIRHFLGEDSPNRSWAGIGLAVRLTMAAYMLTRYAPMGSHFRPVFLADAKTVVGDLLKSI